MSKNKGSNKKRVVTTKKQPQNPKGAPKRGIRGKSRTTAPTHSTEMVFGKQNYILMSVGLLLIILGLVLMTGGSMPDPDVWEPERIYSFRRVTLAPILIIAGLVVEIFAIFQTKKAEPEQS